MVEAPDEVVCNSVRFNENADLTSPRDVRWVRRQPVLAGDGEVIIVPS
jgi:hypothetical protein